MIKSLLRLPISLVTAVASLPFLTQQAFADSSGMPHHGGDWSWEHMIFGSAMMIVLLGIIVSFVVLFVRRINRNKPDPDSTLPKEAS